MFVYNSLGQEDNVDPFSSLATLGSGLTGVAPSGMSDEGVHTRPTLSVVLPRKNNTMILLTSLSTLSQ